MPALSDLLNWKIITVPDEIETDKLCPPLAIVCGRWGTPGVGFLVTMHYYSFHPGDYLRDTAHLTNEEDLAYRRLLDFYHQSELPIPAETQTVSRRLRLGLDTVNQVLSEFFELREDGWHQARCDAAIVEYQRRCGVNREVGKLGGRPKKTQTVSTQNPDGFHSKPRRNPNHKPETNNQKPITNKQNHAGFDEFWSAYPRKEGKPKALQVWNKEKPDIEIVLDALVWQKKKWTDPQFIPHPSTYLNQRRFEDEKPKQKSISDSWTECPKYSIENL